MFHNKIVYISGGCMIEEDGVIYEAEVWKGLNAPGRRLGVIQMWSPPKPGETIDASPFGESVTAVVKNVWRTGTHESLPRRYTVIVN